MQNAVDHAFPEGRTGRVVVRLSRNHDHVLVDVIDDGIGLPASFTLDTSKGLGLSIVHALVTGELDGLMEMRDEHGTTVHVQVPVAMPRVEL
jgi:two-component sensor histidine kinase